MASNINELRKFVAPEIIFGDGARRAVANFVGTFGAERVLLVSDPGVVLAGWVEEVEADLAEQGIFSQRFTSVSPNPRAEEVMAGAMAYREMGAQAIVAIGGGSPMDCAKGIGIVVAHDGHIIDFEGVDTLRVPIPPLIFVPTTAGTSADISQFAIISDQQRRMKFSIVSKSVVPDVSLIDPQVTLTMSPFLTACTGVDALVHAIEAFVSTGSGPLTDAHALEAMRLINGHLVALVQAPHDLELRSQVMLGSMQAGLAFSNAILGAVHAMSHSLGGFLDLPHGLCNSLLLEHVVAYNFEAAPERFTRIAETLGIDCRGLNSTQVKARLIDHLIELKRAVGLTGSLGRLGVHTSDVPFLARHALEDPCILTNPRRSSPRDVQVVYEEAM
ncbi:iron-containing alcohol dehydrogenase [Halomonas daqingensis]|uniref:Iron-containing alcohol dehydrogenase n=2 Tax=Billgrantia TaxID=3137761 RepID=A0ABS9AQM6_9GAMM|nr:MULTISPECIES: alcohol dehydrogenase-like regulatory protein ErcA [Halomonas]MCE8012029.1 iron-containing alcohol dehydrogenase [Halomonas desiderata]MCE8024148.1 iron-containing alcohol dehydrogenase [Halomonas aerodenitrificans]MCE8029149.1 iron-containing alcohol dehydrogenase [Halomonas desiderata]MCE8051790.1 iron-containing alcohol dehydrogenase [Halomonas desiderata]OUE41639.1 alcohol dehydrogenase [Halomonas desiderata SP1]